MGRLVYIDMIRGVAILLVVAAHLIQVNIVGGEFSQAFMFINLFHMPLFFMISGYIGWMTPKPIVDFRSFVTFSKKKFLSLGIPLAIWSLIINYFFYTSLWKFPPKDVILGVFVNPGLWFLLTLLQIFIIYTVFLYLTNKYNKENRIWKDITILVFVFILTGLYAIWTPMSVMASLYLYTLFFYIGVFISKHSLFRNIAFNEITFIVAFLLFSVLSCHWDMHSGLFIDDILKVILAPCAFIVIMNLCKKYEKGFVAKTSSLLGRYSLEIYVVHWYLLTYFYGHSLSLDGFNNIWLFVAACILSIPICYICIVFAKIIEFSPLLRLVIFGRRK